MIPPTSDPTSQGPYRPSERMKTSEIGGAPGAEKLNGRPTTVGCGLAIASGGCD